MNGFIKFILFLCFSTAFIESSSAFEKTKTYTVADGLVGSVVPVIFQDSRGALWFGSDKGGVSHFDGKTFVPYKVPAMLSEEAPTTSDIQTGILLGRTRQIVEDKWGDLWVLTREDSEKTGQVNRFDGTSFMPIGTGNLLLVDKQGDIWVSENQHLIKYVTTGIQKLPVVQRNEIETAVLSLQALTINVISLMRNSFINLWALQY